MKKFFKPLIILFATIMVLILPYFVYAYPVLENLQNVGGAGGYSGGSSDQELGLVLSNVIKAFLGLLGMIFIILIILAGYNWMTASGEEEKITKAKATLRQAIIGLIIIASAYAITFFVFRGVSDNSGGFNTGYQNQNGQLKVDEQ